MPPIDSLLAFAVASFALIIVPGPSVLFVISRGVALGRRAALLSVLGNESGLLVHVLAVSVGLGAVVARSATVFTILRLAGAVYLVFLGVKAIRSRRSLRGVLDAATLPKREDMPTDPLSPYALQKLVAEQYCAMFTRLYGFEAVTIRYFNVFGPRQDPGSPYSGVISLFATAVLEGREPTIYGDGEQTRDFTYVANVVDGVLRACEAPKAPGQVINVATGGRISLNELWATMNRLAGTSLSARHVDPRAGDVRDSQADISKAKSLLGYEPTVFLEEGLRRTIDWYRSR